MALSTRARKRLEVALAKRSEATEISDAIDDLSKYVPLSVADPGSGVAIPVTTSATINIVTAGAETNTLAIPSFLGQTLVLNMSVFVGARVITSAQGVNQAGNTILTFGAARDCIELRSVLVAGALRWVVTGNDGVALT
jgi:hypothetical protein